MTKYQGHSSKTAWNVALWIGNDETLYRLALAHLAKAKAKGKGASYAARLMLPDLGSRTPDGYRYSLKALTEALEGLCE